jgi:hypothetical protein
MSQETIVQERQGIYTGPLLSLRGETALIRKDVHGYVLAQFDRHGVQHPLTKAVLSEGWHSFHGTHFRIP